MVRYHYTKEEKAKDWDFIFKSGLVFTLVLSALLFILNYSLNFTKYPIILFFSLPVAWSIIGLILSRKYSSAEQRDMHKVSDFIVLSLCGFFGAFFLTLYALKTKDWWNLYLAVLVFLGFHYYSLVSLQKYLEQKNIQFNWNKVWLISIMLIVLAVVIAILQQYWTTLGAIILLIAGIIYIFTQYWTNLTRQFWYAQRYRVFLVMGFAFSFLSLVLWAFVFIVVGFLLYYE
ncbi:MAG: hypothetical protein WCV90_00365 [Candidatus Woesearchaeota archaeon]